MMKFKNIFLKIARLAGVALLLGVGLAELPAATIWPSTSVPTVAAAGADSAVALGIRFRADVNGTVTGVRFYKGAANKGTHVGTLWSSAGVALATATFSGESASGWQEVRFSAPVAIAANTTYVASYHARNGYYSADANFFSTAGVDAPPLHALQNGGVYAYGGNSVFPNKTWNGTNYWVDVVFQADVTSAAITTSSLPNGALGQNYSSMLSASGVTAPVVWSISGGTLPPGLVLSSDTGVIGGTPTIVGAYNFIVQVRDSSSPVRSASKGLSLNISSVGASISIWPATALPNVVDPGPDSSAEVGVKFRSDVAGSVSGIRFYKSSANVGPHVGTLWSSAGAKLGSVSFTTESASGWQQADFSTPVAINPNTVYVVSYHANAGHYALDESYFATTGTDNGPLHALVSGGAGGNGLYRYGASSVFPNLSWNASNYWVDVVFQPSAPLVTTAALDDAIVNIAYSSQLDALGGQLPYSWSVVNGSLPAGLSLDTTRGVIDGTPTSAASSSFTVLLSDSSIPPETSSKVLTLTVAAVPPVPILVVTSAVNAFTRYYGEILSAEGLNQYVLKDILTLNSANLAAYQVIILGEMALSAAQVSMLSDWVNAGGNLITMRPDTQLAGLLGIASAGSTLSNGYLGVLNTVAPASGITGQSIQFHGTADRYTLGDATSLATLFATAQTPTSSPAVTIRSVGTRGGHAAAFSFDLARSVVYTRQGNPAWVGQERDGFAPMRSDDLFYGPATADPQPNWIDLSKVAIPQADEQQRLLVNMILFMNSDKNQMPRFWYFPRGYKAVVVMTGDDHAVGATVPRFDQYASLSNPGASVTDWEALRATSYVYPNTPISDSQAAAFDSAGFEIGLHLNTQLSNYTPDSLSSFFTQQLADFKKAFPSLPTPKTSRVHAIVWCGYTTLPEVGLKFGIRLDTSYYYWPGSWVGGRPGMFTGSGIPMRFATLAGETIDVYQAPTQMTDESSQAYPFTIDSLLDRALGVEGYYGAFVANMHTDVASHPSNDAIIASAGNRGVPLISANQLLTWLDARNASAIRSLAWDGSVQTFSLVVNDKARGLMTMVPVANGKNVVSIKQDGVVVSFYVEVIKGIKYAFFAGATGNYKVSFSAAP
jgi:Domain of unknown function (DUF4082)/Putative Ig domain